MSETIRITLEEFLAPWPELQQQYRLERNNAELLKRQSVRIPEADRNALSEMAKYFESMATSDKLVKDEAQQIRDWAAELHCLARHAQEADWDIKHLIK